VIDVKRLPAGHGIGYGHTYVTDRETTVALLPAGYADGLPRNAGNKPLVSINGRRYSIAGRVSMDQIVVDVGDHNVKVGDHAIFFGAGTNGEPTVQDWAHQCDTIAYEIIARLGRRVKHTYVGGGIGGDL
jgi:alanine racemase